MIPKTIFTIWLNDSPQVPELVENCIASQKKVALENGYKYKVVTLQTLSPNIHSKYLRDCIQAKKWVKASDFLRMLILLAEGGIYLDADVELYRAPDEFLNNKLFAIQESNGIYANGIVGAEPSHPLLLEYLRRVNENFRGSGDLVFEPGIRAFADLIWTGKYETTTYPPETFFIKTESSVGFHHSMKSWI